AGFLKKMPANLHAPFVQRKSAQELFDIVTSGQEIMPAFRGELSAAERWSLVTFIQSFGTSEGRLSATHQSEEDP
ncbi:MAG: cytochrome c, partial [Nitrospirota bacterium]|nr:cytochrome c [Nitrospirota bacterium]